MQTAQSTTTTTKTVVATALEEREAILRFEHSRKDASTLVAALPSGKLVFVDREFQDVIKNGEKWSVKLKHRDKVAFAIPVSKVMDYATSFNPVNGEFTVQQYCGSNLIESVVVKPTRVFVEYEIDGSYIKGIKVHEFPNGITSRHPISQWIYHEFYIAAKFNKVTPSPDAQFMNKMTRHYDADLVEAVNKMGYRL